MSLWHQATRLIQKLVNTKIIEQKGKGRGAHYEKCNFSCNCARLIN